MTGFWFPGVVCLACDVHGVTPCLFVTQRVTYTYMSVGWRLYQQRSIDITSFSWYEATSVTANAAWRSVAANPLLSFSF